MSGSIDLKSTKEKREIHMNRRKEIKKYNIHFFPVLHLAGIQYIKSTEASKVIMRYRNATVPYLVKNMNRGANDAVKCEDGGICDCSSWRTNFEICVWENLIR
jgi:hypothetical protein